MFNKQSNPGSRETLGNIQYHPDSQTPAVARWLDQSQLDQLDEFKGAPYHYLRIVIPFFARDTPHIIDYYQAYVANPNKLGPGDPSESYRNYLEVGYREYGFGEVPS